MREFQDGHSRKLLGYSQFSHAGSGADCETVYIHAVSLNKHSLYNLPACRD